MDAVSRFSCEKLISFFVCGITISNDTHSDNKITIQELRFSILWHHCSRHGSVTLFKIVQCTLCCSIVASLILLYTVHTVPLCSLIGPIVTIVTPLIRLHNHITVGPHTKCADSVLSLTYEQESV